MLDVQPITLVGELVQLEPLRLAHAEELLAIGQEQEIWAYMFSNPSHSLADMQSYVNEGLRQQELGAQLPFLIRARASGQALGMTSYLTIEPHHRGLEIGATWLCSAGRRTGVNTECKYLLLRHAFETLGAIRVQLKTDSRNLRSQQAIERIGATKEGVLRNHMIVQGGYYRDSVYYSIIDSEWPHIKKHLLTMLAR